MSENNTEKSAKLDTLPLPFLVFAVIGIVIIGFVIAFKDKIFTKKSNSTDTGSSQQVETIGTDSNDVTPKPEESVLKSQNTQEIILPENTPTESQ